MASRYKVLVGGMVLPHPKLKQEGGKDPLKVMFKPGDVCVSDDDLVARFGTVRVLLLGPAGKEEPNCCLTLNRAKAAERTGSVVSAAELGAVHTPVPSPNAEATPKSSMEQYEPLESHTVADLKEIAATEGVDLGGATTKVDLIKVLRGK